MELKQLSYFVTVVEEGTISSAARKLNLTQPPLSAQMKLLEAECGCLLFERTARRIWLTEAGRLLYGRARTMLELAGITRQELKEYREGSGGTLRLGVVSSVGSTLLTAVAGQFHESHPAIAFELVEANTYQLLEQLKSNLIEIAIVRTPFDDQGFSFVCIRDEPMLAAGHRRYFAACSADTQALPLSALEKQPLILYRRWESILLERFDSAGICPDIFCKNEDARTSALWADAGLGVSILPASARSLLHHPETVLYKIDDPQLHSGICVVHNKDARLSGVAKAFFTYLSNSFNSGSDRIS